MNRQEKTALVEKFLREDLAPYCGENFAIHQVALEDRIIYQEEYWEPGHTPPLHFTLVYEGRRRQIPIEWEIGMSRRIWPKLLAAGVEGMPLFDFAEKSWWMEHRQQRPASKFLFPDTPAITPTEAPAMNRQEKSALVEKFLREDLAPYCGENFAIHQVALKISSTGKSIGNRAVRRPSTSPSFTKATGSRYPWSGNSEWLPASGTSCWRRALKGCRSSISRKNPGG